MASDGYEPPGAAVVAAMARLDPVSHRWHRMRAALADEAAKSGHSADDDEPGVPPDS